MSTEYLKPLEMKVLDMRKFRLRKDFYKKVTDIV